MTPAGLFSLAALAAAFAYSKFRTAKQQRVDHDDVHTGAATDYTVPDTNGAAGGTVVHQDTISTKTWGDVVYRVVAQGDGRYTVAFRNPQTGQYDVVQAKEGGAMVFDAPADAITFAETYLKTADESSTPEPDDPCPAQASDEECETCIQIDGVATEEGCHFPDTNLTVAWKSQQPPVPTPADDNGIPDPTGPTSVGTCVQNFYLRTPQMLSADTEAMMNVAARAVTHGKPYYLTALAQKEIFGSAREQLLSSSRSVRSVVTRDVLTSLAPNCDWWRDQSTFSTVEYLTWQSTWNLVAAAEAQVELEPGKQHPSALLVSPGETGVLVGRKWLDLPDVGAVNLPLGRRVELLAAEYDKIELPRPVFLFGEPIYARVIATDQVTGAPIVKVLAQFQGHDITPRLSAHHGFKVGDHITLRKDSPTGLRKIFAEGVT